MKQFLSTMFMLVVPIALFAGDITVTGSGSVSLPADTAYVSVSVVAESTRPADALSMNNEATNRVFDSLTKLGLKKNEIQTKGLTLTPKYSHEQGKEPRLMGYTVTHTINVTVCRIAETGKVLDTVVKDGANRINNVSFGISEDKRKDALNVARKIASKDAIDKATLYCESLDIKTKELKSLAEHVQSVGHSRYITADRFGGTAVPTNVEGGEIEIQVTISTVWDVK